MFYMSMNSISCQHSPQKPQNFLMYPGEIQETQHSDTMLELCKERLRERTDRKLEKVAY
jgi:hypothetical protein